MKISSKALFSEGYSLSIRPQIYINRGLHVDNILIFGAILQDFNKSNGFSKNSVLSLAP